MELASVFSKEKKDENYSECLWQLKLTCENDITNLEREREQESAYRLASKMA